LGLSELLSGTKHGLRRRGGRLLGCYDLLHVLMALDRESSLLIVDIIFIGVFLSRGSLLSGCICSLFRGLLLFLLELAILCHVIEPHQDVDGS
jgi:hypothetical protein